jgi:hypothetical protein
MTVYPSLNEATNPDVAHKSAMSKLGSMLPRLIYALGTAPEDAQGPILFSTLDIKDGYWRMVVPPKDDWDFTYVLPKQCLEEPTQLVIPSSLQIGWCESPAFFCAASETGRDVAEDLAAMPTGSLPAHHLEKWLINPLQWTEETVEDKSANFLQLMEVYIDDFIQLAQTTYPDQLLHLSRAILHGTHSVFPPPSVTGHDGKDPVSLKKLPPTRNYWDGFLMAPAGTSNSLPTRSPA